MTISIEPKWPSHCHDSVSCLRNRRCMYFGCKWSAKGVDFPSVLIDALAAENERLTEWLAAARAAVKHQLERAQKLHAQKGALKIELETTHAALEAARAELSALRLDSSSREAFQ